MVSSDLTVEQVVYPSAPRPTISASESTSTWTGGNQFDFPTSSLRKNPRTFPGRRASCGPTMVGTLLLFLTISSSEAFLPATPTLHVARTHPFLSWLHQPIGQQHEQLGTHLFMSTPTKEAKTIISGKNDTRPTESIVTEELLEETSVGQQHTIRDAQPKKLKIKYGDLDGEAKVEEPGDRDKIMTLIKQYEFDVWDSEPQLPVETIVQRTLDTIEDAFLHLRRVPYDKGWFLEPQLDNKPTVVVLGSGWAAHALLKVADTYKMRIIVVSPSNHFVFTPMLASASVGTVEYRSMTEAVRAANPMIENYIEGMATAVDLENKTLKVQLNNLFEGIKEAKSPEIEIKYDKLVVGE